MSGRFKVEKKLLFVILMDYIMKKKSMKLISFDNPVPATILPQFMRQIVHTHKEDVEKLSKTDVLLRRLGSDKYIACCQRDVPQKNGHNAVKSQKVRDKVRYSSLGHSILI